MSRFTESCTICVVSTAHLPEELAQYMDADASQVFDTGPYGRLIYDKTAYGYRIWTNMDNADIPPAIRHIVIQARHEGHKWIEFDSDGEKIRGFRKWDW